MPFHCSIKNLISDPPLICETNHSEVNLSKTKFLIYTHRRKRPVIVNEAMKDENRVKVNTMHLHKNSGRKAALWCQNIELTILGQVSV
jgi:hypothetical protein